MSPEARDFGVCLLLAALLHALALWSLRIGRLERIEPVPRNVLVRIEALDKTETAPARPAPQVPALQATRESRPSQDASRRAARQPSLSTQSRQRSATAARQPPKAEQPAPRTAETAPAEASRAVTAREQPGEPLPQPERAARSDPRVRASYEQLLAAWLERHQGYPLPARRRGMEGSGLLRIRIARDGTILLLAVERPLPFPLLEQAAIEMARRSEPFPSVPGSIEGKSFEFVVPVVFRLR